MKSSYLDRFQQVAREAQDTFELVGDMVLVEVIQEDEFKTSSGLVIASGTERQVTGVMANKPTWARILMVGSGARDSETGIKTQIDLEPGDIILLPAASIKLFSVFGRLISSGKTSLGLASALDTQLRFKGQAGFDSFFRVLNGETNQAPLVQG